MYLRFVYSYSKNKWNLAPYVWIMMPTASLFALTLFAPHVFVSGTPRVIAKNLPALCVGTLYVSVV